MHGMRRVTPATHLVIVERETVEFLGPLLTAAHVFAADISCA